MKSSGKNATPPPQGVTAYRHLQPLLRFSLRRDLADVADGTIEARVSGLLPDKWRTLEAIVRETREVGWDAARVSVSYYELPDLQVVFESDVTLVTGPGDPSGYTVNSRFTASFPLERNEQMGFYMGSGTLNYVTASFVPHDDCTATLQGSNGQLLIVLHLDADSPDLELLSGASTPPPEVLTLYCPDDPPLTSSAMFGWGTWVVAHGDDLTEGGFRIRGPWQPGPAGSSLIASTTYTARQVDGDTTSIVNVKVELRRR